MADDDAVKDVANFSGTEELVDFNIDDRDGWRSTDEEVDEVSRVHITTLEVEETTGGEVDAAIDEDIREADFDGVVQINREEVVK